ncbi:MAG: hypothetical protein ABR519_01150 [Bacteroidales bacterium]
MIARRQQATAVVAARFKIVEGAVSMVEMALRQLSDQGIVDLDEEKWASDEFRSTNGQIEYILDQALRKSGRMKRKRDDDQ